MPSSIVYLDQNHNGIRESFEATVVPSSDGKYRFSNLALGDYLVRQELPEGWSVVSPSSGVHLATLTSGQTLEGLDFVNRHAPIVPNNRAPRVTSVPPTQGLVGRSISYQITVIDPDNDPISFTPLVLPSGATLSSSGLLTWNPPSTQLGNQPFEIEVSDNRGGRVVHRFTVNVLAADTTPPVVQIIPSTNLANPGQTIQLQVLATDNVAVAGRTLTINGVNYTLDAQGRTSFTSFTPGLFNALASATDTSGNIGNATLDLRYFDPSDNTAPVITITSPTPGTLVSYLKDVIGSVFDTNLSFWRVDVAPVAELDLQSIDGALTGFGNPSAAYRTIATGSTNVSNARLATFDPTVLRNDEYLIRVYAEDVNGLGRYEATLVSVTGNAKLGNFALEFTDLSVPLAGIPIDVLRRYNTFDSRISGDFGYGWSLGYREADIRETVPDTGGDIFTATPMRVGTRVYINNPQGERIGFTFKPVPYQVSFFGASYRAVFEPDPGVYEKLDYDGPAGEFAISPQGEARVFLFGLPWNPDDYILTTTNGTKYRYNQRTELKDITDLNGNKVTFTNTAITHSSGQSIQIVRDTQNRVDKLIDPNGKIVDYSYDAAGNLVSVEDQVHNTTTLSYLSSPAHYLDSIVDPLGRRAVKTEYDENGRVVAIIDANGNRVEQTFDPAAFTGTRRDANGNVVNLFYNDRGNVTREVDPAGGVTQFFYEDAANPDKETRVIDKLGRTTSSQYDARGNVTRRVDTAGGVTTYQYNASNSVTQTVDPMGRTTRFAYTGTNNLSALTNTVGSVSSFTYDAAGKLLTSRDFNGNVTTYEYTGGGSQPTRIINPDGSSRTFQYNAFGQVTRQTNERGHPTIFRYDDIGRLIEEEDALGNITRRVYDAANNLTRVTDPLGNETNYTYDAANRLLTETNAEGGVVTYTYDPAGNRKTLKDPVGNITTWIYDSQNRVTQEIDPLGVSKYFAYDAAGNKTRITDRLGRVRTFTYDSLNRVDLERWLGTDGSTVIRTIDSSYDAVGNLLKITDPDSTYTYQYDALNRVKYVDNAGSPNMPRIVLGYDYDANGNQTRVYDNLGVQVVSLYDTRNRLISRRWNEYTPVKVVDLRAKLQRDIQAQALAASRVQGAAVRGSPALEARVDFSYCTCGALLGMTRYSDIGGTNLVGTTGYVYDNAMRLTNLTHKGPTGNVLVNYVYTYDAAGRVTSETSHGESVAYTYDRTGQLTDADRTGSQLPDEFYRYDLNGNRTYSHLHGSGYVTGPGNRLLSDGTFNYTYDAEGNMATKTAIVGGNVTTYTYDHRNRLTGIVEKSSGGVIVNDVRMVFDALGRRIAEVSNGTMLRAVHNGDDTWLDADSSNQIDARYMPGLQIDHLLSSWDSASGVNWSLTDRIGSVIAEHNQQGVITTSTRYDSFGRTVTYQGEIGRFSFAGREAINGSELQYNRARNYSTSLGRFNSIDPTSFSGGDANLYRYGANRPNYYTDPSGTSIFAEYITTLEYSEKIASEIDEFFSGFISRALPGSTLSTEDPPAPFFNPFGVLGSSTQLTLYAGDITVYAVTLADLPFESYTGVSVNPIPSITSFSPTIFALLGGFFEALGAPTNVLQGKFISPFTFVSWLRRG
jgi:RHS repeat-associated protein